MNISPQERSIISRAHLDGTCIIISAHAPQENNECHTFDFMRGVLPNETSKSAFNRVKPDILNYIQTECGKSCNCKSNLPIIYYSKFGR